MNTTPVLKRLNHLILSNMMWIATNDSTNSVYIKRVALIPMLVKKLTDGNPKNLIIMSRVLNEIVKVMRTQNCDYIVASFQVYGITPDTNYPESIYPVIDEVNSYFCFGNILFEESVEERKLQVAKNQESKYLRRKLERDLKKQNELPDIKYMQNFDWTENDETDHQGL